MRIRVLDKLEDEGVEIFSLALTLDLELADSATRGH